MSSVAPKQKILSTEKTAKWYKDNANWMIDQTNFYTEGRYEMLMLYQAAMGVIDKSAYKYVLNPYNSTDENLQRFPAQLRNYDIITPIIGLYIGEKADKPFNHTVICVNADAPNQFKEAHDEAFKAALAQSLVNTLNSQGVATGVESKEIPPLEKISEQYKNNYNDKRAQFGQEAVDYIKHNLELKDKYQEALYDWIVTGKCYTYKDVYKDDLLHEIVPPLELWHGTSQTGFVEDANWAVRRTRYNINDCIDRFHEVLGKNDKKEDEIEILENLFKSSQVASTTFTTTPNIDKISSSSSEASLYSNGDLIDVYHCVWKSFRKVGILHYLNEIGQPEEMEVDDTYKLDKSKGDLEVEWMWMNQVEETYRIGESMYKYCRPIIAQRNQLSNTSECKLPYNGRIGYSERNREQSVVKQLLPYQALVNIYHFRRELIIAKNKEKLALMPKGLLPEGWGTDKSMYYADTTSMLWFDETKPNAQLVLNAMKAIDLSLGTYIDQMTNLIREIKAEAWDAVGMNRQRYGDVKASDGKGNTDQAVFRSAIISREMFRRFEKFEESDLQGLMDYSKLAWINGKKGMYINSDGRRAFLEVNPDQHLESDYGIFAVDSADEKAKLDQARQYAFGWAQKGTTAASTVIEILDSNNVSKLKDAVKKAEQFEREYNQSIEKAKSEATMALEQKISERDDKANQTKKDVALINADATKYSANLKASTDVHVAELPDGSEEDASEVMNQKYNEYVKEKEKSDLEKSRLSLSSASNTAEDRFKEAKIALDKEKLVVAERIAAKNKNKYDK